jgi:hypothetical protein
MLRQQTRKYLPQAVPKSTLSAEKHKMPLFHDQTFMQQQGRLEWQLTSMEVVDSDLGKHSIVLNLRLAEGRAVVSNDDQLG